MQEKKYHFLGNAVFAEGRDRTAFAPFKDEPQKFDMGKLALNILGGLAVAGMVFSDIKNEEVSDFVDYAWAAIRESVMWAISGAIFVPAATTAEKMTIGAINNGFESVLRQTLNHEKINPLVVLFDAGLGALTAGVIDLKYGKQIGEAVDDNVHTPMRSSTSEPGGSG